MGDATFVSTEIVGRFTVVTFTQDMEMWPPDKDGPAHGVTKFWVDAENERVMWCHPPANRRCLALLPPGACGEAEPHCEVVFHRDDNKVISTYADSELAMVVEVFVDHAKLGYNDEPYTGICIACPFCYRHGWLATEHHFVIDT